MDERRRTSIFGGALLILVGAVLFVAQVMPEIMPDFFGIFSWPWIVVGIGLFLFALGAALGEPGLAVPATIVGGIGGILAYQYYSNDWTSWSYIWALIPGFVGLGIILMKALGGEGSVKEGVTLLLISFILLAVFGSFFGALGMAGQYWPVLLILLGLFLLGRTFFEKN